MKRMTNAVFAFALGLVALALAAPPAPAAFGVEEFGVTFNSAAEAPVTQAGAHPWAATTLFRLNTKLNAEAKEVPDEEVRNFDVQLPTGFVGAPAAMPQCPTIDFITVDPDTSIPECPDDTAVGLAGVNIENKSTNFLWKPLYNLVPPPGKAARFGFSILGVPATIEVGVNPNPPYNVTAAAVNIPQTVPVYAAKVAIWGEPSDPIHNPLRGRCVREGVVVDIGKENPSELVSTGNCETDVPNVPFLTMPRACGGPLPFSATAEAWFSGAQAAAPGGVVPAVTGCDELGFAPTIAAGGTEPAGESPSGLNVDLEIVDPGLTEPGGRANSDIERTVVTLPEGFTTNPSAAVGLSGCSPAQYEAERVQFAPNAGCPESSNIGTVEVATPLIDETLTGQIYVAKQRDNPFNSLLALYIIIRNERLGILVKQPLKIDPDPKTGRLTGTVTEIPQLPFSKFHLHFKEGPRAPLTTPPTCGNYQVEADLFPYAQVVPAVHRTADLKVSSAAGGQPCASSPTQLPYSPSFSAGTLSPIAGEYSPFVLKLSRPDGSQQFSSISATLPGGLLGRIAGIPYCPDSGLAQAASRGGEGQGALELASPSCPQASEVGTVIVASGAGPTPLYVTGRAYLAGPYKGAPLSLEIITPAIAGPFDLGVVAVRTALRVDPRTSQITAVSDPIPTILHGLPLDVRSITVEMNRPNFTLNPTSCEPKSITGSALSTLGSNSLLSQYFQATQCVSLKFHPKLTLRLKGKTRRAGHPALKAVLTYPKGRYANVARAQVGLPHAEFLDQGNIRQVCTQPQLVTKTCPKKSIYGHAKAWTPLLDRPLEGPVYLGVGYGHKLPDLVADLDGQIRVLLNGKIDQTKQKGLRSTFEAVPDAPISRFVLEMKGGPKFGLIENSENICKKRPKASVRFVAQNGLVQTSRELIKVSCSKKKMKNGNKHHGQRGAAE